MTKSSMPSTSFDPSPKSAPDSIAPAQKQPVEPALKVSVIIVNYNVKDFLRQALLSLEKALKDVSNEIFVVDNASDDGSAEMVRSEFSLVKLLVNTRNLGFAKANNAAIKRAKGDYILLLNPDTIVQEDTFLSLLKFMRATPDAGMVTCKVLNPNGTLQLACRRSYPTPWVAFTRMTGLSFLFPKSRVFGKYNLTYLPENDISPVEAISGSFMFVRRAAIDEIGLLDEEFFLYGEDLDWCYRTIEAGWKIYYAPTTQIVHFKGESSKQSPLDSLLVFYNAMALFAKKHFRGRYFILTYYVLLLAIWGRAAFSFLKNTLGRAAPLLLDFALLQLSMAGALLLKFGHLDYWRTYVPVSLVYSAIWLAALYFTGSYGRWKFSFFRASLAVFIGFTLNSALTYFFKQYAFSRAVVLFAAAGNALLVAGWRLVYKLLHRVGLAPFSGTVGHTLLGRRTLVIGDFSKGEQVVNKLKTRISGGYEIIGLVSLSPADVGRRYDGMEVIGHTENLNEVIQRKSVQEVIFSTHRIPYDRILRIISENRDQRVNFKLIPSNLDVIIGKASIDQLSDLPLLEVDYKLSQMKHRVAKRGFDIIFSTFGLILGFPFFLAMALLHSRRLKTAEVNFSDDKPEKLKIRYLPNKGSIGKLPWLWQVLRGRLSIVGREIRFRGDNKYLSTNLKPGLTGLIQVNRRRNLTHQEKEKLQLFYLTNYSPLLDFEIIFKAIFHI